MPRLIQYFLFLSTTFLLTATFAETEEPVKLSLYTENFGDFNYSLQGRDYEHWRDDIGGTSTATVKALLEETNFDYRMRLRTWSVGYERALDRPYNGIFSTTRTPQREDIFEWVGPIARESWVIYRYKGSDIQVNSLDDLRTLRVGGYASSATSLFLKDNNVEVSTLPTDNLNPQRLAQNQIDVWIASDATAYQLAEASGYPDIEPAWVIKTFDLYLAMNKETPRPVLDELHRAYEVVMQSQTH